MTPPVWLDEARQRLPTRPCRQCGCETPIFRLREHHLFRRSRWQPFRIEERVNWCGHSTKIVLVPDGTGWWREVPIWDPAAEADNPLRRWSPPEGSR